MPSRSDSGGRMGRRHLLTDEERAALFGVPTTRDALAKHYTLDATDLEFVLTRRTPANRLGFAAALALLRHPGLAPSAIWPPPADLIAYLAEQLGIDPRVFDDYARRPQTVGDFALEIAAALGLRPPTRADVPLMVEAAARAAWPTERGLSIVEGLVASLREARLVLPSPDTIERAGLAGRVRARKRAAEALLAGLSGEQLAKLDAFGAVDPETGRAPLTWAKDVPSAPKAEHVREILDKLREVRALGLEQTAADRVHPDRLRMLAREGRITAAYAIERYTPLRRRAILVATLLDLEQRLTDAALGMADRLIGASFTRGNSARERTYTATSREVGRLMRLLHGTAAAVEAALRDGGDVAAAIDGAVGLGRLVRSAPQAAAIADLAEEDPLVRAADRWQTPQKVCAAAPSGDRLQARAAEERADAIQEGVAEARCRRRRQGGPQALRDGALRPRPQQTALGRRVGRALRRLPALRQLPPPADRGDTHHRRARPTRDRRRVAGSESGRARLAAATPCQSAATRQGRGRHPAGRPAIDRAGARGKVRRGGRARRRDRRADATRACHRASP
jgi:Domain of unknown function (DUF4158)